MSFVWDQKITTCFHTANALICDYKSISVSVGIWPQVCPIWKNPRNLGFSCIPPIPETLSDTVHVAVACALRPDFGSMLSWKTERA